MWAVLLPYPRPQFSNELRMHSHLVLVLTSRKDHSRPMLIRQGENITLAYIWELIFRGTGMWGIPLSTSGSVPNPEYYWNDLPHSCENPHGRPMM